MNKQLRIPFAEELTTVGAQHLVAPDGYKGLYRFHKYWGKKPRELLAYLVEQLTVPGDIVLDPFVGFGAVAREAVLRGRKFVGFDLNPVAIELTRLLIRPPCARVLRSAIRRIEQKTKAAIGASYTLQDAQTVATHYLWDEKQMDSVWVCGGGPTRKRRTLEPTDHDRALSDSFATYSSKRIRQPMFFANSRINATPTLTLDDILTGRAQRNLDLLIEVIEECPPEVVPALKLCLTAASGQTTKMVFAVTGRGKTTGQRSEKVEVGSWVIGYWRPKLHFEVNVWNCFEKRTRELLKAVNESDGLTKAVISDDVSSVISGAADAFLACGDCRSLLSLLPEDSVQLVVTDPPHSDRIPYLELSEFWNSILGASVDFEREIVISNAKERNKTPDAYRAAMLEFLGRVQRVLSPSGILVVLFNSREEREWDAFRAACGRRQTGDRGLLQYLGHFPCRYSAGSVVQDNRKGSLKHDLALVFVRSDLGLSNHAGLSRLRRIAGWSCELPCKLGPMGAT